MNIKQDIYQLNNGMILLGERLKHVHSVSFQFLLPAGAGLLPDGCCGAGAVISDWLFRGAGNRTSRQLIQELDHHGIHRSSTVSAQHLSLSASLEASNLSTALDLYADILLRPQLAADQFELSRQLAVSDLDGLDDDPRQKAMILLNEQFYPDPMGRPAVGKAEQLKSLSCTAATDIVHRTFDPRRVIFSICGNYDFNAVCKQMEILFQDASAEGLPETAPSFKGKKYSHFPSEGAQVHIGLMTPVPTLCSEYFYDISAAVSILSGSMSSRLFTEVREKRGLCYAVGARYKSLKKYAGIACYAGTTPDKAQETVDVIIEQFDKLKDGISDDELGRAKVGLKTSLIMQSESTGSRCAGISSDYFMLGRIRQLDEIRDRIEDLTVDSVLSYLNQHPMETFTGVSIGSKQVTI